MSSGSSARLMVRMKSAPAPMLVFHEGDLALADAVLAGAGALHAMARMLSRPTNASVASMLPRDRRDPSAPAHGNCRRRHGRRSARSCRARRCRLRSPRCIRRAARSARRHRSTARWRRAERHRRPIGVVPGLPQLGALFGIAGRDERPAAEFGDDLAERRRLLGDPGVAAMELEEQAGRLGIVELRIGDQARICSASSSSILATGMPIWMVAMTAEHAASTLGNGQTPPAIAWGMP